MGILDFGFKVIIAPSFADIFYNNALKNGIVPIKVGRTTGNEWLKEAEETELTLTVDLESKTITDQNGNEYCF